MVSSWIQSLGDTAGGLLKSVGSAVGDAVDSFVKQAPAFNPQAQQQAQQRVQQNVQTLKQIPQNVANYRVSPQTPTLGQAVKETFSTPNWFYPTALANNKAGLPKPLQPLGQSVGRIGQDVLQKPFQQLSEGVKQVQQPGIGSKLSGGLNLVGGGFGLTPMGAGFNAVFGAGKEFRKATGQDTPQNEAIANAGAFMTGSVGKQKLVSGGAFDNAVKTLEEQLVKGNWSKDTGFMDNLGKIGQRIETNPGVNRANLGLDGEYLQRLGEALFGKAANTLTNKQLYNAIDLAFQTASTKAPTGAIVGLSTKNVRGELPPNQTINDVTKLPETKIPPIGTSIVPQEQKLLTAGDPEARLREALSSNTGLRAKQEALYTSQRAQRIAEADKAFQVAGGGEAGFNAKKAALGGKFDVVNNSNTENIGKQISQSDLNGLINQVETSPNLSSFDKIPASQAIKSLVVEGKIPTNSELDKLSKVFTPETIKAITETQSTGQKIGSALMNAYNLPRELMAGIGDLSATLMQNSLMAYRHPVITVKNFVEQLKMFKSQGAYEASQAEIAARPNNSLYQAAGLELTNVASAGVDVAKREEQFMTSWGEKIPGLGRVIRATGRAYVGFLNRMRADVFDTLVNTQKGLGLSPEDPKFLADAGHWVNIATGRGDIKLLERYLPALGQGFFSARKLFATAQTLNPVFYIKANPVVRKEALLTMLSFLGGATAITQLSKLAGATVSDDSTNADYGKIKIGNTRINMYGPYQQLAVLFGRMWKGYATSSTSGNKMLLGDASNPYSPTRLDLATRFFESKEHPTLSLALDALRGSNQIGQPFQLAPEVLNRMIPMILSDSYDLYLEHGPIGLLGMIPAFLGLPVQTYGTEVPNMGATSRGQPKVNWSPIPDLGTKIWNTVTNTPDSNIPPEQWDQYRGIKQAQNERIQTRSAALKQVMGQ